MSGQKSPAQRAIDVALEHYGSLSQLAPVVGLTPQGLSLRVRQRRGLSAEECFQVHRHSGIALTKLRPDLWGPDATKDSAEA